MDIVTLINTAECEKSKNRLEGNIPRKRMIENLSVGYG